MRLAVIGCGFVGGTIADALENAGNDVVRIDPKYNVKTVLSLLMR